MREKKEINIQIGNEIRAARERVGLTQAEFGEMMSLDTKNVSDIERGVTGIRISTLKSICEKMSISSDVLLFGEQGRNDVEYLADRLKRLPPEKFEVVKELINQIFETFALLSDE